MKLPNKSKKIIIDKVIDFVQINGLKLERKFYKYLDKLTDYPSNRFRISFPTNKDKQKFLIVSTYSNPVEIKINEDKDY